MVSIVTIICATVMVSDVVEWIESMYAVKVIVSSYLAMTAYLEKTLCDIARTEVLAIINKAHYGNGN